MERLLVVRLDVLDCEAEVVFNGIVLARAGAARPRAIVPVHEYTIAGTNRLELVIWPQPVTAAAAVAPPVPLTSSGSHAAQARVLLPRVGNAVDASSARTLIQIDWAPATGATYDAPVRLSQDVSLPVSFPRWRWLDAAPVEATPALRGQALALVQTLARDLADGRIDRYVATVRLRTEEIALAYQRRPEHDGERLRAHLATLHAQGCLQWSPATDETFALRALAGGRLHECLDTAGGPALRTDPDTQGCSWAFPLRLAAVGNTLHVLR